MAKLKPELKEILDRYGIAYQDKDKLWDCHGTLVLYHKAYEIIAAKENIQFDPPSVIEGRSGDKIVALLVMGHMGDRSEWSIGEAAPGNNKNSYPYAMAEKRAKDRVIAKLVGLSAYVYSEDEADDFKTGAREPVQDGGGSGSGAGKETEASSRADDSPPPARAKVWTDTAIKALQAMQSDRDLDKWLDQNTPALEKLQDKHPDLYETVQGAFEKAKRELSELRTGAAA